MAVPKNATILRGAPLKSGVMLGVSPSSDPTFDVEIARATSSGVYATITRMTPKGEGVPALYTDVLPVDGFTRSYKARAVKDGWLEGDYTAVVSGKPIQLPEIGPNITPLTGQTVGAPLFISTGAPPQYGKANNADAYTKSFTVYPFEFSSTLSAVAAVRAPNRLYPVTALTAFDFYAPVPLPANATVTEVGLQYRRNGALGVVRFRLQVVSASTITVTAIDYTATGTTGTYTKNFTSGVGTGGVQYYARMTLTSTDGTANSVYLNTLSFTYTQPNVAVGV